MGDITQLDGQFCLTSQQKDEALQCKAQAREREKKLLGKCFAVLAKFSCCSQNNSVLSEVTMLTA